MFRVCHLPRNQYLLEPTGSYTVNAMMKPGAVATTVTVTAATCASRNIYKRSLQHRFSGGG